MKKFVAIIILAFFMPCLANASKTELFSRVQSGGAFVVYDESKTTGDIFWVDSGAATGADSAGYGLNPDSPVVTLDYAVGLCLNANDGCRIIVMPGHAENLAVANAVDVDVAGVEVIGLGDGAEKPTFTFTATAGEFVVGAANVTVRNVRFAAGISAVTMGISVEAAGDNFTLKDCEFPEPTTSSFEFLDAIDLAAGADGVTIDNVTYYNVGAIGADHFLDAGNGVNNNLQVKNSLIMGEFAVAAIWSDTADLLVLIENCNITNVTNGQHAIEFTAAATGTIRNTLVRTDVQTTAIDPGSMTLDAVTWDDDATADTVSIPVIASSAGSGTIGTINETTTDTVHGKLGTDTELADSSLFDLLVGGAGVPSFPASALPANAVSIAEVIREAYDQQEKSVSGSTAVMIDDDTIFTIAGGPIKIIDLISVCITSNDGTASTLQYTADPTVGGAVTISGASASLAAFAAGGGVVLNQTALATAPDLSAVLVGLGSVSTNRIIVNEGVIKVTVGVGSTTGTWKHYLRYKPLARGVTVAGT